MSLRDVAELLTEQAESGATIPGSSFTVLKTTRIYKFKPIYKERIIRSIAIGSETDQGLNANDGYMIDWNIETAVGYQTLTCVFSTNAGAGELPAVRKLTNKPFFSLTQSPGNIPLEQLDGFRTNWIYDLAAVDGTVKNPAWYLTATDTAIPDGDEVTYAWVKDTSQTKAGWYILQTKDKKGATEKQNSNPVVQENYWTETLGKAILQRNADTIISEPSITFGILGEWLKLPSTMQPDGDLWKVTTTYLNAETWDTDIYG